MEPLSRNEKITLARKNHKNISYKNPKRKKKNLVKEEKQEENSSNLSFQIRLAIASFLFLVLLGMKEHNLSYKYLSYDIVLDTITDNSGMEAAEEIVISTFNSLD